MHYHLPSLCRLGPQPIATATACCSVKFHTLSDSVAFAFRSLFGAYSTAFATIIHQFNRSLQQQQQQNWIAYCASCFSVLFDDVILVFNYLFKKKKHYFFFVFWFYLEILHKPKHSLIVCPIKNIIATLLTN